MSTFLNSIRTALFGAPINQLTTQTADVTDELKGAGIAFGTLIEAVGRSVATTQAEMDATSGKIASQMAKTKIDVVRAVVTRYGDDGNILNVTVNTGETSALSLALPPALAYSRVRLEGQFFAQEFSQASQSVVNVNISNVGFNARGGRGGFGAGFDASTTNVTANTTEGSTSDLAVGRMVMTAQVRPKTVRRIPDPPLVLRGPRITLTQLGSAVPQLSIGTIDAQQFVRVAQFDVLLDKPGPLATDPRVGLGKPLAIDAGALEWLVPKASLPTVTSTTTLQDLANPSQTATTDSNSGQMRILVYRTVSDVAAPAENFVLTVSLGLIRQQLGYRL